jgi:receptor tyrosine kinase-like orphan receptor 1
MHFVRQLNNITRDSGKSVKLNCEVTGEPPPLRIQWYMNEVPVGGSDGVGGGGGSDGGSGEKKSKPRLTVKRFQSRHKNGLGSRLRINKLEVHDKGFFTCEATNGIEKIQSTAILIVKVNRFSEFQNFVLYTLNIYIHIYIFI